MLHKEGFNAVNCGRFGSWRGAELKVTGSGSAAMDLVSFERNAARNAEAAGTTLLL